jgi:hypothetical protein
MKPIFMKLLPVLKVLKTIGKNIAESKTKWRIKILRIHQQSGCNYKSSERTIS